MMLGWQIEPHQTKFISDFGELFIFFQYNTKNFGKEKITPQENKVSMSEVYVINSFSTKMPNRTF